MFIFEISEKIEKEVGKFRSEEERRTTYQSVSSDIWFDSGLTELEREIATVFLTELVSVGESVGDFDNESNSFFCKNNVTGEEKEFFSLFEWSEWFTLEKNYSDSFSIRRAEWKYEEATLAFKWVEEWGEDDSYIFVEKWKVSYLPDNVVKQWSEFFSELTLRANAA